MVLDEPLRALSEAAALVQVGHTVTVSTIFGSVLAGPAGDIALAASVGGVVRDGSSSWAGRITESIVLIIAGLAAQASGGIQAVETVWAGFAGPTDCKVCGWA